MHLLNKNGFYQYDQKLKTQTTIFSNDSSIDSFQVILKILYKYYNVGLLKEALCPLRIHSSYQNKEDKKKEAITLFKNYLGSLQNSDSNEEKISKICCLCREIEQLHLFLDGNGRSVFILANILAHWNMLDPFYPKNIYRFHLKRTQRD